MRPYQEDETEGSVSHKNHGGEECGDAKVDNEDKTETGDCGIVSKTIVSEYVADIGKGMQ